MTTGKDKRRAEAVEPRDTWSEYFDPETRTYTIPYGALLTDDLGEESAPETPDFVENPQKTPFRGQDAPQTDANALISDNVRECPQSGIDMDWVCDVVHKHSDDVESADGRVWRRFHNGAYARIAEEIADMVERDYVRREDHEDAVTALMAERDNYVEVVDNQNDVIDGLKDARDELASMVEDVTADFATAVKQRDEWMAKAQSKNEPVLSEGSSEGLAGSSDESHDTREKLEEAANDFARYCYGVGFTNGTANAWNDDAWGVYARHFIALLDRQAEITKREMMVWVNAWKRECREWEACTESYTDADAEQQNPRSREADSESHVSFDPRKVTFNYGDTRGKLEADAAVLCGKFMDWITDLNQSFELRNGILRLLDRQKAITEREQQGISLQARVDANCYKAKYDSAKEERNDAMAERDELADDLAGCEVLLKEARLEVSQLEDELVGACLGPDGEVVG